MPAYRAVAGDLRLSYSQFEELEAFARFGTRLDEQTRHTLERGRRVRELLKQDQYDPLPVADQIAVLLAVIEGIFDHLPLDKLGQIERKIHQVFPEQLTGLYQQIQAGEPLADEDRTALLNLIKRSISSIFEEQDSDGNA